MLSAVTARSASPPLVWTMRLFPLRPDLHSRVRRWRTLGACREADALWEEIRAEVGRRVRSACRRRELPGHEAEDLEQEVLVSLYMHLRAPAAAEVRSYDAYVKAVISNAARGRIRRNRPVWNSLKDDLVETLRGRRGVTGFALWRAGGHDYAGFAAWAGTPFQGSERYFDLQTDPSQLRSAVASRGDAKTMPLHELLKAIFDWLRAPMPVNELTTLVFELQERTERRPEPLPPADSAAGGELTPEQEALQKETAAQIARVFQELPRERCAAFLLHLTPPVAWCLLSGIDPDGEGRAALPLVAWQLGLAAEELERYLDELPWDDLRIAELLDIRRGDPAVNLKKSNHDTQMVVVHLRRGAAQFMQKRLASEDARG